jgi:uncharacterized protein YjbI with pentapeptide repeats
MILKDNNDFMKWVKLNPINEDYYNKTSYRVGGGMLELEGIELINLDLEQKHFESTEFKNCVFDNCQFHHTFFNGVVLENCHFRDCRFTWSKFLDVDLIQCQFEGCIITGLELADIKTSKLLFINCGEILDMQIRPGQGRDFTFINSYIAFLDVEPNKSSRKDKFEFIDCLIKESSFDTIDFTDSVFEGCSLSLIQFSDCILTTQTLSSNNETPANEYNHIDIRTILNSNDQNINVLENLFGIHNPEIKDYLIGLTSKIQFQSIFISYSFSDKKFASIINSELMKRGILTFLWEKDAPGGKQLKDIMKEGVNKKDRVLFIASQHSLKSTACHFELTQGRKKQEKTWEDVLFPIHIDNYLFEIAKDKIRPKEVQEEYWQNIEELRSLNSIDFSEFQNVDTKQNIEFDKVLFKLIKGLRKEK